MKALNWVLVLAGIWLIISPWVLGYNTVTGAMGNNVVLGVIVGVIGLVQALGGKKEGGGNL